MPRATIPLIMFLALVPVTLLVPGLHELVRVAHGGSEAEAHAFMTVNMIAGLIGVPLGMVLLRRTGNLPRLLALVLLVDALAFLGMGAASSVGPLFGFRALDGFVHLPAVTLLMVASNRLSGERRGGSLGALASAIMVGVAVGSPLGGWLVQRGTWWIYGTGAALLVIAAALTFLIRNVPAGSSRRRYSWNRGAALTWIPLGYGFMDRFSIGVFVSTFTLFLADVHGLSATERGLLIALFMLPFAVLCYPVGRMADKRGWFAPMLIGNVAFGLVFALYGLTPRTLLPVAMLLSGVFSALMFTPNLLLISDLVKRGHGEGLFGAFQVAGSVGFLAGPIAGGVLVEITKQGSGRPAYEWIFATVGLLEFGLALASWTLLRGVARKMAEV